MSATSKAHDVPSPSKGWTYYVPALFLASVAIYLRIDSTQNFADRVLWAEDGDVFIRGSHALGFESLYQPSAGYLHLYPRIISLIANQASLTDRPEVLLLGWLLAYYFTAFCAARMVKSQGGSSLQAGTLALLIGAQPHHGEVLFTVTNAQWHLGAALIFIALTRPPDSFRLQSPFALVATVFVLGLTGPFSIMASGVVLMLMLPFRRNWRGNLPIYLALIASAAVQIVYLLNSARGGKSLRETDPIDWVVGTWRYLTLGADKWLEYLFIVGALGYCVYCLITLKNNETLRTVATGLLAYAISMGLAGMYSQIPDPLVAAPLGNGNRYNWVPYAMVLSFICIVTIDQSNVKRTLILTVLLLFCAVNFRQTTVDRPYLNFRSFAKLSESTTTVIPIHPIWPMFPGWNVSLPPLLTSPPVKPYHLAFEQGLINAQNEVFKKSSNGIQLLSEDQNATLTISTGIDCHSARDIGVEIDMIRNVKGDVVLRWSDNPGFSDKYSFRRWYPDQKINAQFAFSGFPGNIFLQIVPLPEEGNATVQGVRVYCLN